MRLRKDKHGHFRNIKNNNTLTKKSGLYKFLIPNRGVKKILIILKIGYYIHNIRVGKWKWIDEKNGYCIVSRYFL